MNAEEQAAVKKEYQAIIDTKNGQKHQNSIDGIKHKVISRGSGVPY